MEDELIEKLLEYPRLVVDFLPRRVEKNKGGQFFAVERYYLKKHCRSVSIRGKFADIIIKLNCYFDITVIAGENGPKLINPDPKALARLIKDNKSYILILIEAERAAVAIGTGDTHMTVYGGGKDLDDILIPLAESEGLFLWEAGAG